MKKIISISVLTLLCVSTFAQGKPTLNKRETVEYLNKKIEECEGHYRTIPGEVFKDKVARKMYYQEIGFYFYGEDENIVIGIKQANNSSKDYSTGYFERHIRIEFNPSQIVSITNETKNEKEPVGIMVIHLKANSALYSERVWFHNGKDFAFHGPDSPTTSEAEVGVNFLNADPENFNKMKKALEHLRDLYKADKDPFGE